MFYLLPLTIAFLCATLPAQELLYTSAGNARSDLYGTAVADAGDVNRDGFADWIVGAPEANFWRPNAGEATVYSGQDGSVLYELYDGHLYTDFGATVGQTGDVNLDGYGDFFIGVPGTQFGCVNVYSGLDGRILQVLKGVSDSFGESASLAGDVNSDGFPDLIVGDPYEDHQQFTDAGSARVFSGLDGSVLYVFYGNAAEQRFGSKVAAAGDVDGDSFDDVIVSSPWANIQGTFSGITRIYSGSNGSLIYDLAGSAASDFFGNSIGGAGDVNRDGFADFFVGANGADAPATNAGSVNIYSGFDGSVLLALTGNEEEEQLGFSASNVGDINGDSYDDLIVGARGSAVNGRNTGIARVYSGLSGEILFEYEGEHQNAYAGTAVGGGGDINADGYPDAIVGANYAKNSLEIKSGNARVFAGGPAPALRMQVTPIFAGGSATVTIDGASAMGQVSFFLSKEGPGTTFVPVLQVTLQIEAASYLGTVPADQNGRINLSNVIPSALQGREFWLQAAQTGAVSNWLQRVAQ